ncbi:unnamed protein product, partial [Ectocarpus sp. 12 AP-2014]
ESVGANDPHDNFYRSRNQTIRLASADYSNGLIPASVVHAPLTVKNHGAQQWQHTDAYRNTQLTTWFAFVCFPKYFPIRLPVCLCTCLYLCLSLSPPPHCICLSPTPPLS